MINRSNLNLVLEIDQKSAALDNYRMFLQSMLDAGGGKLVVRITGPLSRPRTELPGMGAGGPQNN
jgi:hypothetical protein